MSKAHYVYAIVRSDATLPANVTTFATSELAMVAWRELAAVTRQARDDQLPLTLQAVMHHELVVEAVREQGPALPVRFGTVFRSAESIASALANRYDCLTADLARLGDKGELSLTALWAAPPAQDVDAHASPDEQKASSSTQGARYLRARAADLRRDEAIELRARLFARQLDQALGKFAIAQRVSLVPAPRIAIRASYLLDSAHVNSFRTAFEEMRREHTEFRILLTGPWPPYSFVSRTGTELSPERMSNPE